MKNPKTENRKRDKKWQKPKKALRGSFKDKRKVQKSLKVTNHWTVYGLNKYSTSSTRKYFELISSRKVFNNEKYLRITDSTCSVECLSFWTFETARQWRQKDFGRRCLRNSTWRSCWLLNGMIGWLVSWVTCHASLQQAQAQEQNTRTNKKLSKSLARRRLDTLIETNIGLSCVAHVTNFRKFARNTFKIWVLLSYLRRQRPDTLTK